MDQRSECKETGNQKKNNRTVIKLIPIILLFVLAVFTLIKSLQYGEELIVGKDIEFWTHDNVLKFNHTPLKDGEIVQKFKAAADDMTEFILEFDDYSANDTASLIVTLEDKKGNEYYRYECPTMAFGENHWILLDQQFRLPLNDWTTEEVYKWFEQELGYEDYLKVIKYQNGIRRK